MPRGVEELIAAFKGARDVREGLRSVKGAANQTKASFQNLTSVASGINSTVSALTASLQAVEGLTGAVGAENVKLAQDVQRTIGLIQSAIEGLELLPAGLQNQILSIGAGAGKSLIGSGAGATAGAAALGGIAAAVAVFGATLLLVKTQMDSFEERFKDAGLERFRTTQALAAATRRLDRIDKDGKRKERDREFRNAQRVLRHVNSARGLTAPDGGRLDHLTTDLRGVNDDLMDRMVQNLERRIAAAESASGPGD